VTPSTAPVAVRSASLGVLGGTFDPFHLGHLALARTARDELGLERVLVTCDDDNAASMRVIEKNGGVFLDLREAASLRRPKRRYWIESARR
jgi:cytidyltransferase-like protein